MYQQGGSQEANRLRTAEQEEEFDVPLSICLCMSLNNKM